ncbi:hypothetical protein SLS62_000010 [Diatrype stigma]|uniref:Chaperone DnaJ C-terminal domain-containing protein n=1 Tax=Diatrype stigma TaxID=117547 RepID=A0AAN9VAL7_9PEZI
MASFGWSVGDVVAVGKLAWKLYNGSRRRLVWKNVLSAVANVGAGKNAGEEFRTLTEEVRALQAVLQEVGEELTQPKSVFHKAGKSQRMQLANLMNDCNTDLRDLERFLLQHRSLNTSKPRYWDRIRFGAKSTEGIRQKLSRHTEGLNLFLTHVNTLSLSRIEQASESSTNILSDIVSKLDQLRQEVQTGQKDGSVFNVEANWSRLEQELVGQHITERDVVTNRKPIQDHVMKWLDDVRDDGARDKSGPGPGRASSSCSSDPKRSSSMLPWCPDNVPTMNRESKRKGGCYDLLDPQEVAFLTSNAEEHEERGGGARCESPTSFLSRSNTNTTSVLSESSRLESDQATGITTPDACESYVMGDPSGQLPDQRALIDQLDAFLLEMGSAPSLKPTRTGSSSMSTATGPQAGGNVADTTIIPTSPDVDSGHQRCRRSVIQALPLTFEEALFGCTKYEAIPDGRTVEVVVPAGAHQGSRIGFSGIGVDPDGTIQDLEFIVEWKPHHLYDLEGEHLVYTVDITLLESLCGWSRTVPTLDGQKVRVERQEVTPPSWSTVYAGLGMPRASRPGARSNLAVRVSIKYPERISHEQKKVFQTTFGGA